MKKIGFIYSKKIGFFLSKKSDLHNPILHEEKIGFFWGNKIGFTQPDFKNPIVRSHMI